MPDPRKLVVAAAVAGGLAGCSATDAPSRASAPAPVTAPVVVAPTDSTTTSVMTTTTTVAPARPTTAARPAPTSPPVTRAARSAAATCPSNLASRLASTGAARQLVTVESTGYTSTTATVELWQRGGACWVPAAGPWTGFIGHNGFSDHKAEGDGTTPTGIYRLGPVIYGNAPNPGVQEPYHVLRCGDWWDEDPSSPGYNTFQQLACNQPPSFHGGSEALWQETAPYPSFAVINYNTGPIVKGAGSAIFLHASTGGPTVGCVSVPLADLDIALRWLDPAGSPAFVMGPTAEITRF